MTVAAEPSGTQTNVLRSRRGRGGGLRLRLAGLAALCGVLLGILAFPQAALAQGDFTAAITQGNDPQLDIGGATATVNVSVMATFAPGQGPKDVELKGRLSGLDGQAYIGVGGACEIKDESTVKCAGMNSGETREVQFIVTTSAESDLPQGESQSGQLTVDYNGGSLQTSVTVRGTAAAGVSSISGTVQSNGAAVEGAKVEIEDSEGHEHDATTDGSGNYTITGDSSNPIVAGEITMKVTADKFEDYENDFTVNEGSQTFTQNVTLAPVQEEQTSSAAPTSDAATSESPEPDTGGEDEGMSGTLIILIIIGALLVVGGIVGIVFLLRGGKDDKDDDDAESFSPDGPPDHTPTAAQVGTPGVYQAGPAPGSDAPTMIHPGGLVDAGPAAPTQFGPAYGGGADSTQVMPQGGFGAAPGMPGGQVGPDGTTILPVVKQPGGPDASDATQIMPQANLGSKPPASSAPPSPYGDLGSTRPHPGPSAPSSPYADPSATRPHPGQSPSPYGDLGSTRPHAAPTPPPATGSMFEPQNPGIAPSAPLERSYGSPSAPPSAPQYGPGSQSYGAQGGQQGYGSPSAPSERSYGSPSAPPSAPRSAPPNSGDPYSSQSMRRDPYAPPEQPPPPTGEYGATRAMPQHGDHSQPPAAPYGEPNRDAEDPDAGSADRRNWGEWDDRPRSW